jgi:hypothetical protein
MTTQPASPTVVTDGDRQVLRTTAHPGPLSDRALVAPPADRHAKQLAARDLAQLRRFQWAVRAALGLGVAASVCANVLHAQHNVIAQTIAAWPPLALMLTVELISRVPVYRRTLAAARILATISIAGIAAYVSYFHMAAVVSRYGEHQPNPYLLPISVDGLIVVASVSLVELAGRVRAIRDTPSGVHRGDSSAQDQRHADAPSFEAIIDRARNNGHRRTRSPRRQCPPPTRLRSSCRLPPFQPCRCRSHDPPSRHLSTRQRWIRRRVNRPTQARRRLIPRTSRTRTVTPMQIRSLPRCCRPPARLAKPCGETGAASPATPWPPNCAATGTPSAPAAFRPC